MFKNIVEQLIKSQVDYKIENSVYPISVDNLEPIMILIKNCIQTGQTYDNVFAEIVAVSPSIWLDDFLSRNIQNIKYITSFPSFSIMKINTNGDIMSSSYLTLSKNFNSEYELDNFLSKNVWKNLVIYSITRIADLRKMTYTYTLRYADITEEYEVRDNKINEILNNGTNIN
jgi:hypothetical protein